MEEEALRAEYQLGLEVELFKRSPVGAFFISCCEQDRLLALEDLSRVDAEDAKAIRAIQQRIAVCEAIPGYIEYAITRSYQAEEALKGGEE